MNRLCAAAVVLVLLAGCGGDDAPDGEVAPTTTADSRPDWLGTLGAPGEAEEGVTVRAADGSTERVWVDQANRMVYARTCDIARLATEEGGHYGPGQFGPTGFAYICP